LVTLARINQQIIAGLRFGLRSLKKKLTKGDRMAISNYLDARLVVFLEEKCRDDVIDKLIKMLDSQGKLPNVQEFHQAILQREKIVSTGIGIGVAIPHARIPGSSDFFIAIGIQKQEGIDWNALDGSRVRFVFMIGGPDNKQTEYLKILSCLTQSMKDEQRRKDLLRCERAEEVLDLFKGC
jgi:nitrogen PTS system EIIA component